MNSNPFFQSLRRLLQTCVAAMAMCLAGPTHALVSGWEGEVSTGPGGSVVRTYNLTARDDFISTSDGNSFTVSQISTGNRITSSR